MPVTLSKTDSDCFTLTDAKWTKIINILMDKIEVHSHNNNNNNHNPFSKSELTKLCSKEPQCLNKEQLVFFKNLLREADTDDRWYQLINFLKTAQELTKC